MARTSRLGSFSRAPALGLRWARPGPPWRGRHHSPLSMMLPPLLLLATGEGRRRTRWPASQASGRLCRDRPQRPPHAAALPTDPLKLCGPAALGSLASAQPGCRGRLAVVELIPEID